MSLQKLSINSKYRITKFGLNVMMFATFDHSKNHLKWAIRNSTNPGDATSHSNALNWNCLIDESETYLNYERLVL